MPHPHDAPPPVPTAATRRRRRAGAAAAVALAVLTLHLVVVREVSGHTASAATPAEAPTELRRVVLAPLQAPDLPAAGTTPSESTSAAVDTPPTPGVAPAAPLPRSADRPATAPPAPTAAAAHSTQAPDAEPLPAPAEPALAEAAAPGAGPAEPSALQNAALALVPPQATALTAPGMAAAAPATGASEPAALPRTPTYAATPPRAAVLRYQLRRGLLSGEGSLQWRPQGSRYELTLEARVLGFEVLQQRSSGGFDAAGLAPVRFTDRRKGRDLQAANFQRDKALVSFSGPSTQWPLPAGAQDRVSWLVQLAAIANARSADPLKPGERLQMPVFGARGDASVWTFVVVGTESIALQGDGLPPRLSTLRLRRQPDRPHDTHADAWLDPTRQHLPVKVEIGNEGSDPLELLLTGESTP